MDIPSASAFVIRRALLNRVCDVAKVYISGDALLFHVSTSVTEIDAQVDLYSDWKEWKLLSDNTKYPQAFRTIGGDSIGAGREAGDYYFLLTENGWRIRTWDGHHDLTITGNLYSNTSGLPLTQTVSGYTIGYYLERSQLTQSIETGVLTTDQGTQLKQIWQIQGLDASTPVSTYTSSVHFGSITVEYSGIPDTKIVAKRI